MAGGPDIGEALASVLDRADALRAGGRRDGDEVVPLGPKATKTRDQLMRAAYEQLIERGYIATSVEHIHEAAGVSLGTFYQYFRDKADLMGTLVGQAIVETATSMFRPLDLAEHKDGIEKVIDGFVRGYARTAKFQRVWEQATHVDDDLAAMRRDVSRLLDEALSDAIVRGQRAGIIDPELPPGPTSTALAAMVDRYCYVTYVIDDDRRVPPAESVATLVKLWTNALGIDRRQRRRRS